MSTSACGPNVASSTGLRWSEGGAPDELVKLANGVPFVDAQPEFGHVNLDTIRVCDLDAILISNHDTLACLPHLLATGSAPDASASLRIYATEPTVHFGRLLLEDMLEHLQRAPASRLGVAQRKRLNERYESMRQVSGGPALWEQMCTRQELNAALDRITPVAYNEIIELVDGTQVVPLSSGFAIGACNWKITRRNLNVSIIGATSLLSYHPAQANLKPLGGADVVLLSSLNATYPLRLEVVMPRVKEHVQTAISQGGVALIPIKACGLLFDLLALLRPIVEGVDTFGSGPKVYVVAPSAKAMLAYANIYAEWLCPELTESIYNPDRDGPEEPFRRGWLEMVEQGRVKVYAGVEGDFSSEFRPGCVVLTTDSSLRLGPVTHLLPMLADNPNNTIICVDPDIDASAALIPYRPMNMKAVSCPLDSRLTPSDVTKLLQPQGDQKQKSFELCSVLAPDSSAMSGKGGLVLVPDRHDRSDKGAEHAMTCVGLANKMVLEWGVPVELEVAPEVTMAVLDQQLEVPYEHTRSPDGSHTVKVAHSLKVSVTISADLLHTSVRCDDSEARTLMREIFCKCLSLQL